MRSMTAYAASHKSINSKGVQIVMRSLNFKYLDVLIHNLSIENILLEEAIKREVKKRISRGKIGVFIFLTQPQAKKVYINEKAIAQYISQIRRLTKKYKLQGDIRVSNIVNLPQVVSWEQMPKAEDNLILPALKEALGRLIDFKKKEGKAIKKEVMNNLCRLKGNIQKIKKQKPKIGDMENGKEDIDEELSLISFYINKLKDKVNSKNDAGKGKSMDFLTQEILRELNAASSKTRKRPSALLIVESKNYLERIREQAQNVE